MKKNYCQWWVLIFLIIQCLHSVNCSYVESFPPIEIIGAKIFNSSDGRQFFLKGIAYQPQRTLVELEENGETFDTNYIDPLADPYICLRDLSYLQELGINTIRVYSIDPTLDHDECMHNLMKAGIYVILDLAEPETSIVRNNPSWDIILFERYKAVVDTMSQYPNVLGYFAGNEVTNDKYTTGASPFVKAAIRDTKKYINEKGYRNIPVGYSSNDDIETRDNLAQYFICGDTNADFYGINMYEWCGYSSYKTSGYEERTKYFKNYPIPVFFSEFGCNVDRPRPFTEVTALFGQQMSKVWSGGLVYMYFEEENNYGVVKVGRDGKNITKLPDFQLLKNQFLKIDHTKIGQTSYVENDILDKSKQPHSCPKFSLNWQVMGELPPTPDDVVCNCLTTLPCLLEDMNSNFQFEDYFIDICKKTNCSEITSDAGKGIYGKYSFCSNYQKISYVASRLYYENNATIPTCPFDEDIFIHNDGPNAYLKSNTDCKKILDDIKLLNNKHFLLGYNPYPPFLMPHGQDNIIIIRDGDDDTSPPKESSSSKISLSLMKGLTLIILLIVTSAVRIT
ncbi:similar to Saccharomyces cerevisiae YLR343W GAS2 1,3-beta-glucanosyltransferase, involved with Gas4p in spore wall assembly [Maudiozyma barnettii]|nr:similar to Saccharomyces cerevisiae YLR343W GAS2 1,3-beta-glucanosyltransferase, involved with Gas4p in spore wall assembly [Kazachstania barnettii]